MAVPCGPWPRAKQPRGFVCRHLLGLGPARRPRGRDAGRVALVPAEVQRAGEATDACTPVRLARVAQGGVRLAMTGPVLWYGAVCGALAGAALPHACARIVASLRPYPDAEHVVSAPRARLPPRGGWSPQHTRDAILSGLGLAAASAGVAWRVNDGLLLVAVWLVVLYAGLLLAVVDIMTRRLPTPIVAAAALAVGGLLAGHAFITGQTHILVTAALAAGALGGVYLLLAITGGSGMGLGDVRLAALLGASLGTLGWPAVLWGGLLPYALAAPEALTRLTLRRQPDLAFGPYLLAGAFLSVALVGP